MVGMVAVCSLGTVGLRFYRRHYTQAYACQAALASEPTIFKVARVLCEGIDIKSLLRVLAPCYTLAGRMRGKGCLQGAVGSACLCRVQCS